MRRPSPYLRVRSVLDRLVGLVALGLLSPVLAVIAVAVRTRMGSPILFRQQRVGRGGTPFTLLKFRTMVNDAERLGGGYMPPELDLVPPLGAFLRRTSLDELPQLVNMVRGDIALIGPRPALPDQFERYTDEQRRRVTVPQGLTGLAQVRFRNEAPWSVRIESDLEYIDRLGPRIDVLVLLRTIGRVVAGAGVRTDQRPHDVDDLGPRPHPGGDR